MQTIFSAEGTIYTFENGGWVEMGEGGEIFVLINNNNEFDIRLCYALGDNKYFQMKLKPHKLRSKGQCSWIFRYKFSDESSGNERETYVAVQFFEEIDSNNFQRKFEQLRNFRIRAARAIVVNRHYFLWSEELALLSPNSLVKLSIYDNPRCKISYPIDGWIDTKFLQRCYVNWFDSESEFSFNHTHTHTQTKTQNSLNKSKTMSKHSNKHHNKHKHKQNKSKSTKNSDNSKKKGDKSKNRHHTRRGQSYSNSGAVGGGGGSINNSGSNSSNSDTNSQTFISVQSIQSMQSIHNNNNINNNNGNNNNNNNNNDSGSNETSHVSQMSQISQISEMSEISQVSQISQMSQPSIVMNNNRSNSNQSNASESVTTTQTQTHTHTQSEYTDDGGGGARIGSGNIIHYNIITNYDELSFDDTVLYKGKERNRRMNNNVNDNDNDDNDDDSDNENKTNEINDNYDSDSKGDDNINEIVYNAHSMEAQIQRQQKNQQEKLQQQQEEQQKYHMQVQMHLQAHNNSNSKSGSGNSSSYKQNSYLNNPNFDAEIINAFDMNISDSSPAQDIDNIDVNLNSVKFKLRVDGNNNNNNSNNMDKNELDMETIMKNNELMNDAWNNTSLMALSPDSIQSTENTSLAAVGTIENSYANDNDLEDENEAKSSVLETSKGDNVENAEQIDGNVQVVESLFGDSKHAPKNDKQFVD